MTVVPRAEVELVLPAASSTHLGDAVGSRKSSDQTAFLQQTMSTFGSPGGRQSISKPVPPERGSFPLDHDAECQQVMKQYLRCLKSHRGLNDDECRELSKNYLQCRMDR